MISSTRNQNDRTGKANQTRFLYKFESEEPFRNEILKGLDIDVSKFKNIEEKAGMKYNFDFLLQTTDEDIKLELKVGKKLNSIYKLPEILQVSIKRYPIFMQYVKDCYECLLKITSRQEFSEEHEEILNLGLNNYCKDVFKINNHSSLSKTYERYKTDKTFNKLIADEYRIITNQYLFNIDKDKLKEFINYSLILELRMQTEKNFILFDSTKEDKYKIQKIYDFKYTGFEVDATRLNIYTDKYIFGCLLRWKNGTFINNPCLQISIKPRYN